MTRLAALRAAIRSPGGRLLLSGSVWALVVQIASKFSVVVTTLVAARVLGVDRFGLFVSLQALALFSVSLWDFGFSTMATRDLAARQVAWPVVWRRGAITRLWLSPIWATLFAGGAIVLGIRDGEKLAAAAVFGLSACFISIGLLINASLQGRMRFRESALAGACGRVAFGILALLIAVGRPPLDLLAMSIAALIGEIVITGLYAISSWRTSTAPPIANMLFSYRSMWSSARRSVPFALNGFFNLVYNRLDVAIVALVGGATAAGIYAPASRVQDALLLFPTVATAGLMPIAARRYGDRSDPESIRKPLPVLILLSVAFSLPATIVTFVFARQIVHMALGSDYAGSIWPVRILALSIPFIACGGPVIASLVAIDRAASTSVIYASGLIVAVVGLLVLTPLFGATGAAWASMIREPVMAAVGILVLSRAGRPVARRYTSLDLGLRLKSALPVAAVLGTAAMAGVGIAAVGTNPKIWAAIISAALSPALLVAITAAPALAVGFLGFSQILEAFELKTPAGSFSAGVMVLLLFLGLRWPEIRERFKRSGQLRFLLFCIAAMVFGHALQVQYSSPGVVLRGLVTLASFMMFWLVGIRIGGSYADLRALAIGSFAALCTLGFLGMLASTGRFPAPDRIAPARDLFGFVSPFRRNYGLNIGYDSTALLLSLCAPFICLRMLRSPRGMTRVISGVAYVLLILVTLLVLQSRSMMLELAIIVALTVALTSRSSLVRYVTVGAGLVVGLMLLPGLQKGDAISSELRSGSYSFVLSYIQSHPSTIIRGADMNQILEGNRAATKYGELIGEAPVHNLFFNELLQGGIVSAAALALLFFVPLWNSRLLLRGTPAQRDRGILVVTALATALTEIMINPIQANAAGLWLALGFTAALSVMRNVARSNERTSQVLRPAPSGRLAPVAPGLLQPASGARQG